MILGIEMLIVVSIIQLLYLIHTSFVKDILSIVLVPAPSLLSALPETAAEI